MAAVEHIEAETELSEADAAALERFVAIAGRAGALMRCEPQVLDTGATDELLGPYLARNLDEVALACGVTVGEVESWVAEGMPGPVSDEAATAHAAQPRAYWPPSSRNCALLRRLRIRNVNTADVSLLLGHDFLVKSQPGVAAAFGVGLQSVKGWASAGLPKPKRGEPYNLIESLRWRLVQDDRADKHQGRRRIRGY